jgi:hypothetical protein
VGETSEVLPGGGVHAYRRQPGSLLDTSGATRCLPKSRAVDVSAAVAASTPAGVRRKMSNLNVRHRVQALHRRHQPKPPFVSEQ